MAIPGNPQIRKPELILQTQEDIGSDLGDVILHNKLNLFHYHVATQFLDSEEECVKFLERKKQVQN